MMTRKEAVMLKGKFYMVCIFGTIGLCIAVYGLLAVNHVNTDGYVSFIAPVMAVLVSAIVISKQIDDVRDDAATVKEKVTAIEEQTNGKLTAQFADMKRHVTKETSNGDSNV